MGTQPFFGTKAETLAFLAGKDFPVPESYYFSAAEWKKVPAGILAQIQQRFSQKLLAVRSSAMNEDGGAESMAGAFESVLNVPAGDSTALTAAVNEVITHYSSAADQVLVQGMVANVAICGVAMTRALEDGSPYYVLNYDDVSGRTDMVTSGQGICKTVCIYKGVQDSDFDSSRLRCVLQLLRQLEAVYEDIPLDVEFAVDAGQQVHLLQVRRICTTRHWRSGAAQSISQRIRHVESYVADIMAPRRDILGQRTLLGIMPDWNPAEIIGVTPRPLAMSLYRSLITSRIWSRARARMGYRPLPPTELMLSLAGRPYIDVRASFNSFLPMGISDIVGERLVNAWLNRLAEQPALHDKVEFEVAHTVLDFDFAASFTHRYNGVLSATQTAAYTEALRHLTNTALTADAKTLGSLDHALATAAMLERKQQDMPVQPAAAATSFSLVGTLALLLEECREFGTLPFSVVARHAFMAEALLRSAVRCGALEEARLAAFKSSLQTVSGDLSEDFRKACANPALREAFMRRYGHLRPGTYDILTPCYAQREDLFAVSSVPQGGGGKHAFACSKAEDQALAGLLQASGLTVSPRQLLAYAGKAIVGREWVKFIFTRHVCAILEHLAAWGEKNGLTREDVSMLNVDMIENSVYAPLPSEAAAYYGKLIAAQREGYELACSFRLSHLIRSSRDVYVAAQQRSVPNFITQKRVEAPVVFLQDSGAAPRLDGALVCIESADPGYDWLFTRNIAGLITCYGGTNSHMAIRCAEYDLPAAIGCGTILFEKMRTAQYGVMDCASKTLAPLQAH